MVLALCVAALLWTLAFWAIAKAALAIMSRFGVEPMSVLVWFGLAERPGERAGSRSRRLGELYADSPFTSLR